jgi:flagellar basal-body rod protein FlgG
VLEGLYTAAAGMAAQERRLDAVSNDIANVNTAGYKKVRTGFRDLVYQADGPTGVRTGAGAAITQLGRTTQQGALQQTGNAFDLAIQGQGYFQVRRADGQTVLTRNGAFNVDARGRLANSQGELMVPGITIPAGIDANRVSIASDGTITSGARRIGQIQIFNVTAPNGLSPAGDNNYLPTAASGPVRRIANPTITQGVLESSNVDLADAMVDMMDAQRSYSMASKAIHMADQMAEIANGIKPA